MTHGKETCKILKEIRQQIADKNEIEYITSECHFQGECKGTCPKCASELKYLENELQKRRQLGKVVAVAGISLGIVGTFSACNTPLKQTNMPVSEQEIAAEAVSLDTHSMNTIPIIAPPPPVVGSISHIINGNIDIVGDVDSIFDVIEISPEFLGGEEACMKFLEENVIYPQEAKENGIEGQVVIGFIVDIDGSLTDLKILRGKSPILDEEALRVVKLMPKWKAGEQKGKVVRVQYQMPITFSLENDK